MRSGAQSHDDCAYHKGAAWPGWGRMPSSAQRLLGRVWLWGGGGQGAVLGKTIHRLLFLGACRPPALGTPVPLCARPPPLAWRSPHTTWLAGAALPSATLSPGTFPGVDKGPAPGAISCLRQQLPARLGRASLAFHHDSVTWEFSLLFWGRCGCTILFSLVSQDVCELSHVPCHWVFSPH